MCPVMKNFRHHDSASRQVRRIGRRPEKTFDLRKHAHNHKIQNRAGPRDDPLLQVQEYSYDGLLGPITNEDIDVTVYRLVPPGV